MDDKVNNKIDKSEKNKTSKPKKLAGSVLSKKWHNMPVVVIGLVALIFITGGIYLVANRYFDSSQEETPAVTTETILEESGLSYYDRATQMAFYGDYDGAQQLLQDGADNTKGDEVATADFYVRKTELAVNNGHYEEGLSFAISADSNNPTVLSASLVATSAELIGDNETAIKYFTFAADRTSEEEKTDGGEELSEYYYFIGRIKALGGTYEE